MGDAKDGFRFLDDDKFIRRYRAEECELATRSDNHYVSERLNAADEKTWPNGWPRLLLEALREQERDERWLARQLAAHGFLGEKAARLLADQHFKRFHIAAVCRRAEDLRQKHVWVYRARASTKPRAKSEDLVGQRWSAASLLEDMRSLERMHACDLTQPGSGLAVTLQPPKKR